MGAGVIPFYVSNNKAYFLFQRTFSGRKTGYLIDFGGRLGENENYRQAAIREFIEETETMYFAEQLQTASRSSKAVEQQIPIVEKLFNATLNAHPDWYCQRATINPAKPKQWQTFFIEFPFRDIQALNREWRDDKAQRFKKRRELVWVEAEALLEIYASKPDKLWKRVRQLENATALIRVIQQTKAS